MYTKCFSFRFYVVDYDVMYDTKILSNNSAFLENRSSSLYVQLENASLNIILYSDSVSNNWYINQNATSSLLLEDLETGLEKFYYLLMHQ